MSAKNLIDGVRRNFAIPLGLNRSRDVIARLVYGSPYSATLAAENDGQLNPPAIADDRTELLASTYGPWVRELAEVARLQIAGMTGPFALLSLEALLTLANLSARRDADGFVFQEPSAVSVDPPAWVEQLTAVLEEELARVDSEAIIELAALVQLGSGEGDDYARLLAQGRSLSGYGCLSAWLSAMPIHRYAAKGLANLGEAGLEVIAHHPEMSGWLVDPRPAEQATEELSLESIAQLERELEELTMKARLPKPFEFYASSTCQTLDQLNDLDYFGCDEQMPYLTMGYAKRQYAVVCICGDLQIGKAYYFAGEVAGATKRISHARKFISALARTIEEGPRMAEYASKGGLGKARKLEPLKRELMRLIEAQRPAGGWRSMERTAAALLEPMLKANSTLKSGPVLSGSLESTLVTWLSKDPQIRDVYSRNRFVKATS